jgi:hypothetical protein
MSGEESVAVVWKRIDGYTNYEISNVGQVRNSKSGITLKHALSHGYWRVMLCQDGITKQHRIHRLVASAFVDNPENKQKVDHIDCDKTNNCYRNLRWVSTSENAMNARKRSGTTSRFKGVVYHRRMKKWCASIRIDGKLINIGSFDIEEEARDAHDRKAVELFGEFARPNSSGVSTNNEEPSETFEETVASDDDEPDDEPADGSAGAL